MYLNNPLLRGNKDDVKLDSWQIGELIKCIESPAYFILNYIKIEDCDMGLINIQPREYILDAINHIHNNLSTILKFPRQSGKSLICDAYLIWTLIFHYNSNIVLIDSKKILVKEQLRRIKSMISKLPLWLQSPILTWNEQSIKLSNGSISIVTAANLTSLRGLSPNIFYLNEFAYWDNFDCETFLSEYLPYNHNAKVIINSTPNKFNDFWKLCNNRYKVSNRKFKLLSINWNDVPGRDDSWKAKTINKIGINRFKKEYECKFN